MPFVISVISVVQKEMQTWSIGTIAVNVGDYLFIELDRLMDFHSPLLAHSPSLGKGVAHDRQTH